MSDATPQVFKADLAGWVILVAGLGLLALLAIGSIAVFGRGSRSWGQTCSKIAGLWWLVPVVAVGFFVVAKAGARFEGRGIDSWSAREAEEYRRAQHDAAAEKKMIAAGEVAYGYKPAPEWISQPSVQEDDMKLLVVSSQQFATIEEAERDADQQAVELLKRETLKNNPSYQGEWILPQQAIEFRLRYDEEITRHTKNATFTVYRVHKQLAITPETEAAIVTAWQSQIGRQRLWALGGVVVFLTLLTGGTTSYLRLDRRTGGQYRGRLKLATASLVAAGGLVVALLV